MKLKIRINKDYCISKDKYQWILMKWNRNYKFYPSLKDLLQDYVNLGILEDNSISSLKEISNKIEHIQNEITFILKENG